MIARMDPVLAASPFASITVAPTRGVRFSTRRPPVHGVLLGPSVVALQTRVLQGGSLALPANEPHRVLELASLSGGVAYLDARWYRFEDAQRLAIKWRGFVPGHDDVRELLGDALAVTRRRVDARLLRALGALETCDLDVHEAARRAKLSDSRLTHLMTDVLGAPPRSWRTWFKLRRAIGYVVREGSTLTEAAHRAGFADSAHFTRTCRQLMGVAPARVMPKTIYSERSRT
ncbi:MAG: helix-turn-helix domain-containing protein [Polyangiales bacterium]